MKIIGWRIGRVMWKAEMMLERNKRKYRLKMKSKKKVEGRGIKCCHIFGAHRKVNRTVDLLKGWAGFSKGESM